MYNIFKVFELRKLLYSLQFWLYMVTFIKQNGDFDRILKLYR